MFNGEIELQGSYDKATSANTKNNEATAILKRPAQLRTTPWKMA